MTPESVVPPAMVPGEIPGPRLVVAHETAGRTLSPPTPPGAASRQHADPEPRQSGSGAATFAHRDGDRLDREHDLLGPWAFIPPEERRMYGVEGL